MKQIKIFFEHKIKKDYIAMSAIEEQIQEQRKEVDFDTREFTIQILVNKYLDNIDSDENELYVPEYQREFVWDDTRQSRLIESIVLGLPIPIIFVAENSNGKLEIVDGSQRIRTLAEYLTSGLELTNLERLTTLNGTVFSDLDVSRQRKINNTPIRMVVLSEGTTEQVKNDLFERINRGSDVLRNMEKRKGIFRGKFNDFIYKSCGESELLKKLAPLEKSVTNRQEHEELILRFFALTDSYPNFKTHKRGIGAMLDEYFSEKNTTFSEEEGQQKLNQFNKMLSFVKEYFPLGFSKKRNFGVSRVYFEAISVGIYLALLEQPSLKLNEKVDVSVWLRDPKFKQNINGKFKTHIPINIKNRAEYVKQKLLEMAL